MSSIALQGGATGTGVVSLLAPSTSTNRTLTLPDAAGTVATAESTLTQFNASGSAPVYACRAWVNFNGTGTVAIRASGNVSSITDNVTGFYTVNFITAMPDANYSYSLSGIQNSVSSFYNALLQQRGTTKTTSSFPIEALLITGASSASAFDVSDIQVAVFR